MERVSKDVKIRGVEGETGKGRKKREKRRERESKRKTSEGKMRRGGKRR